MSGTTGSGRTRPSPAAMRVTYAMLGGAVSGLVASQFMPVQASVLLGWDIAVLIYLAWTWSAIWRLTPGVTARLAKGEDPSTAVAELTVVDFNEEEPPNYIDFAYFSFTVGMTFQVADTNITTKVIRRMTLHHALLSYLYGAVLLGLVINVVSALLK